MSRYKKDLGDWGEALAVKFLQTRGYIIRDQKFASHYGEIDIITEHPDEPDVLCCVEVKTRISTDFGAPEEAVTPNKIKRLHDTACSYFYKKRIEDKIFRLDIISILVRPATRTARIRHLKSIGYG